VEPAMRKLLWPFETPLLSVKLSTIKDLKVDPEMTQLADDKPTPQDTFRSQILFLTLNQRGGEDDKDKDEDKDKDKDKEEKEDDNEDEEQNDDEDDPDDDDEEKKEQDVGDSRKCNALVLLIGMSVYDENDDGAGYTNLEAVSRDLARHRTMWTVDYGYHVEPTREHEDRQKGYWTAIEILQFLEEKRELLFADKASENPQYDSVIIVMCGHGINDAIISSDNKQVSFTKLISKIGAVWKENAGTIPWLFVFDCCRSLPTEKGAVERGKSKFDRTCHPGSLIYMIHGNSPSLPVKENQSGGYFSLAFVNTMRRQAQTGSLHDLNTLVCQTRAYLKKHSKDDQLTWVTGDPMVSKFVFVPRHKQHEEERGGGDKKANAVGGGQRIIHQCQTCNKRYANQAELRNHEQTVHSQQANSNEKNSKEAKK